MTTRMLLAVLALAASADDAPPGPTPETAWRYVSPPPGDPFEHPPVRAIALGSDAPEDVVEEAVYRGRRRRYGQLRYGSPNSIRVTLVVDELGPGSADLYIDADRDRRIEPEDRVAPGPDGRTWRTPLDAAVVEGEIPRLRPRAAIFRLGATGITFSHAAAGYLDGTVGLGDRRHAARRTDGDGNGQFTDAQDRLWIDLDDDGRFDPVAEQFLYNAILDLGPGRYAVRSDPYGMGLSLDPLEGTATIRLAPMQTRDGSKVVELSATLVGREGSVVALTGDQAEATVPVGAYRVGTVTLTLTDPDGGATWGYLFSDIGRRGEPSWYEVDADQAVTIDPIGALDLVTGLRADASAVGPGDDLTVEPRLYSGDGLLIVTCYRGPPGSSSLQDGPGAEIVLEAPNGRPLGTARSGFA